MDNVKVSPVRSRARSQFPLNKMHTTTSDFFRWDVVHCVPMVQNDVFSLNIHSFIESAPNPFPINGSASYGMYAFFVPNRLVWKDWKFYIENLKDNLTIPYFTIGDLVDAFHSSSNPWVEDYMDDGLKYISNIDNLACIVHFIYDYSSSSQIPAKWRNLKLNAMPLRMANRIWFDWMRDKVHISDSALESYCKDTGGHITIDELIMLCAPRYRCFPKNFFTTSFDSPQEGLSSGAAATFGSEGESTNIQNVVNSNPRNSAFSQELEDSSPVLQSIQTYPPYRSGVSTIDLAVNVNDVRYANSIQQYAERLLVAGKTVLSRALALFGVAPTIEELQMSNYLGGHEEELQFRTHLAGVSTHLQGTLSPIGAYGYNPNQGNLAGQKFQDITTSSENGCGLENISYKSDESGYLFVFGAITPHVQYFQGLPRNWTRGLDTFNSDRFDFFHSDMENAPLQTVLNYEILADELVNPKDIYAFNLMYQDYKMSFDSLGGDFVNPNTETVMKSMHLGRDVKSLIQTLANVAGSDNPQEFLTPAVLSQSTGADKAQYDTKFSITQPAYDHFIINHKINVVANRPMQQYCLPSLDASLSAQTGKDMVETGGFRL